MFTLPVMRTPQSLCSTALQHLIPHSMHTARIVLSQVQNLALALDKFHPGGDCLSLICQSLSARPLCPQGNPSLAPPSLVIQT